MISLLDRMIAPTIKVSNIGFQNAYVAPEFTIYVRDHWFTASLAGNPNPIKGDNGIALF